MKKKILKLFDYIIIKNYYVIIKSQIIKVIINNYNNIILKIN